jgi:hypothetical protein
MKVILKSHPSYVFSGEHSSCLKSQDNFALLLPVITIHRAYNKDEDSAVDIYLINQVNWGESAILHENVYFSHETIFYTVDL